MIRFRFQLEKVLEWRHTQLEMEEARFQQQAAALAALDRSRAELEAEGVRAEVEVRRQPYVTGGDLEALGRYRLLVRQKESEIDREREKARKVLAERQAAMMEARRRYRLLEKLKERRMAEWQKAQDRELDEIAAESFLAKWNGREQNGSSL